VTTPDPDASHDRTLRIPGDRTAVRTLRPRLFANRSGRWLLLVSGAASAHALVTLSISLTRLYTGKVAIVDLGAVDQAIWTALHYAVPTTTIYPPFDVANWLGFLFAPVVLIMVPVYALAPFPELLLALQSASVAGAAIPVFLACRRVLERADLAAGWSLLYLVNPFVFGGVIWEFHEKSLATLAIAVGFWALLSRRHRIFVSSMVLLVMCREHYGVAVAGFGALWLRHYGRERAGFLSMALGAVATTVVFLAIMPALNVSGGHPILDAKAGDQLARYGWLQQPAPAILGTLTGLAIPGVSYLAVLLVTTGGTALLAPAFLAPGLADLAANLLSVNPMPRSLSAYHSMALVPVFVIAAAQGSVCLAKRGLPIRLGLAPTLVLLYMFLPAPVPGSRNPWQVASLRLRPDPAVAEIRALLPADRSLSAQANIGSFFSQRLRVYRFPARLETADAVVLRLVMPFEPPTYAPFSNPYAPREMPAVFDAMEDVLQDPSFGVLYWERGWLVAVRGAADAVARDGPRRRLDDLRSQYEAAR